MMLRKVVIKKRLENTISVFVPKGFPKKNPPAPWASRRAEHPSYPLYHHLSLPFDHLCHVLFLPSLPCTFDLRSSILEFHSPIFLFPWPWEVEYRREGGVPNQHFRRGGGRGVWPWPHWLPGQGSLGPPRPPRSEPRAPKSDPRSSQDSPRPARDPPRATPDP